MEGSCGLTRATRGECRSGGFAALEPPSFVAGCNDVRALTGGVDFALDATGSAPVVAQAFRSLRPGGTAAFVGTRDELRLPSLPFMQACVLKGVTEGDSNPSVFIPRLIELWRAGQFPVERLIGTYPFGAINQAIADVRHGTAIKAVILMPA